MTRVAAHRMPVLGAVGAVLGLLLLGRPPTRHVPGTIVAWGDEPDDLGR